MSYGSYGVIWTPVAQVWVCANVHMCARILICVYLHLCPPAPLHGKSSRVIVGDRSLRNI